MKSSEWKNFLSNEFDISKSQAKQIYHQILTDVTYYHWLAAFKCRTHNKDFDKSYPRLKCVDCKFKKYCYNF